MTGEIEATQNDASSMTEGAGARSVATPSNNLKLVVFWVAGALVSFSTIAISLRELSRTLGVFDMLSLRSGSSLLFLMLLALIKPELRKEIRPRRPLLHVWRNIAHFAGTYAWSYAVTVLPLALVFALEFTNPLWVTLFAAIFLRERLTRGRIGAVLLGFLGILVIMRPGAASLDPRAFWPLAAAILFAATSTITKAMTRRDSTYCILFWMNAIQLPLNFVGADWTFYARADGSYTGETNVLTIGLLTIPERTLVNARLGLRKGPLDVALWSRNVGDKKYVSAVINQPPLNQTNAQFLPNVSLGERRTIGLTATYSFGD